MRVRCSTNDLLHGAVISYDYRSFRKANFKSEQAWSCGMFTAIRRGGADLEKREIRARYFTPKR